jgi:hypothetical protein
MTATRAFSRGRLPARAGDRSGPPPSGIRPSRFWPSTKPVSFKPCRFASKNTVASASSNGTQEPSHRYHQGRLRRDRPRRRAGQVQVPPRSERLVQDEISRLAYPRDRGRCVEAGCSSAQGAAKGGVSGLHRGCATSPPAPRLQGRSSTRAACPIRQRPVRPSAGRCTGKGAPNAGAPESRRARSSTGLLGPRARAASLLGCAMIACTRCWLAAFSTGTFRLDTST